MVFWSGKPRILDLCICSTFVKLIVRLMMVLLMALVARMMTAMLAMPGWTSPRPKTLHLLLNPWLSPFHTLGTHLDPSRGMCKERYTPLATHAQVITQIHMAHLPTTGNLEMMFSYLMQKLPPTCGLTRTPTLAASVHFRFRSYWAERTMMQKALRSVGIHLHEGSRGRANARRRNTANVAKYRAPSSCLKGLLPSAFPCRMTRTLHLDCGPLIPSTPMLSPLDCSTSSTPPLTWLASRSPESWVTNSRPPNARPYELSGVSVLSLPSLPTLVALARALLWQ